MLRLLTASALLGALAFSCSKGPPPIAMGPVIHFEFAPEIEARLISIEALPNADFWREQLNHSGELWGSELLPPVVALLRAPDSLLLEDLVWSIEEIQGAWSDGPGRFVLAVLLESDGAWELPASLDFAVSTMPAQGTHLLLRSEFTRLFVRMNPESRRAECRWEAGEPPGNGHWGTPLLVEDSSWMTLQGWTPLPVHLSLWGLDEGDLGPEIPVWFEESTTVGEARSAWAEFAAVGVRLLDLQIFSISEDPPAFEDE
jgi:hypothetical protein